MKCEKKEGRKRKVEIYMTDISLVKKIKFDMTDMRLGQESLI
jgi:hypothetical protein